MIVTISAPRFAALALFAGVDETRYYLQQVNFQKLSGQALETNRLAWFEGSPGAYVGSATDGTTALRVRMWGLNRDETFPALQEAFGIKPERALVTACKTRSAHSVSFDAPDLTKDGSQVVWQVLTVDGKLLKQGFCETAEGTFPDIARVFPRNTARGEEGAFVNPLYMERAAKACQLIGASGVRIDGSGARDPLFIQFGGDPDACGLIMPLDVGRPPAEVNERLYRSKASYKQAVEARARRMQAYEQSYPSRAVSTSYVPEWARS